MTNKGYTLIELMIGITIAVMIFLTASSVLAVMFRSDVKTKRIEELEQSKNDLQVEITNTIRWAESVSISNSPPTITADTVIYTLKDERVYKNDSPLTPSSVAVKKMQIRDFSNSNKIKSLEITIDMENKQSSSVKDTMRIIASQRKTVFEE